MVLKKKRYSQYIPIIRDNLKRLKYFGKLGFKPEEILNYALNKSRYNLFTKKQFHYNGATIFLNSFKMLKSSAKYVLVMDKLLGKLLKKYNPDKEYLKKQFIKNFADFGFTLAFVDFCIKKNIKIQSFEPTNPISPNKRLDLIIKVRDRPIFVEIVSPIESTFNGKKVEDVIKNEITAHNLAHFKDPLVIVINLADPHWSNNKFNAGLVSNEMFYPCSVVKAKDYANNFKEISAIIIKTGKILTIYHNNNSINKLTNEEHNILSKPFLLQRIRSLIFPQ